MSNKLTQIIVIILIIGLSISAFIRNSQGFYDHDEFGHYLSLKSINLEMLFGPWQRIGFKLLYLPFGSLSLAGIRIINLLLALIGCFLLYKLGDFTMPLIFLTFPFIQQLGFRFYAETPTIFLLIVAIYLLYKNKFLAFTLVLSYCSLIRGETMLLFFPAAFILRKKWKYIPVLLIFPILYYITATIYYGSLTEIFNNYFSYSTHVGVKGNWDHYLKASISAFGIWLLLIFPKLLYSLKYHRDHRFFMAASSLLLLGFYSCSYWSVTGFGPIIGIERHILLIAPMVTYFAYSQLSLSSMRKFKAILLNIAFILIIFLPPISKEGELKIIEKACDKAINAGYNKLYHEHPYINFYLKKPLDDEDVLKFDQLKNITTGDVVIWDHHYGAKFVDRNYFGKYANWEMKLDSCWVNLWKDHSSDFVLVLKKIK